MLCRPIWHWVWRKARLPIIMHCPFLINRTGAWYLLATRPPSMELHLSTPDVRTGGRVCLDHPFKLLDKTLCGETSWSRRDCPGCAFTILETHYINFLCGRERVQNEQIFPLRPQLFLELQQKNSSALLSFFFLFLSPSCMYMEESRTELAIWRFQFS